MSVSDKKIDSLVSLFELPYPPPPPLKSDKKYKISVMCVSVHMILMV